MNGAGRVADPRQKDLALADLIGNPTMGDEVP
jgi:hypothetical protein